MQNNQKELVLLQDLGVQYPTPNSNYKKRYGLYKCHCGKEFKAQVPHVKRKLTTSCGCVKKAFISNLNKLYSVTHNLSKHRLYDIWAGIIDRCNNPKCSSYVNYGARGIKVCDRWLETPKNFIEDMYSTFEEGLSIDRINVNGNYEPDNCRWSNNTVQSRNTQILRKDNKSGYRGVSYLNKLNKWQSLITINSNQIYLGIFDDKIEAAKA